MYKPDVIALFPREVQDLARRGVYTLFLAKDGKTLLAKGSEADCFQFDGRGGFIAILPLAAMDMTLYEKLDLIGPEHLANLAKIIRSA